MPALAGLVTLGREARVDAQSGVMPALAGLVTRGREARVDAQSGSF